MQKRKLAKLKWQVKTRLNDAYNNYYMLIISIIGSSGRFLEMNIKYPGIAKIKLKCIRYQESFQIT